MGLGGHIPEHQDFPCTLVRRVIWLNTASVGPPGAAVGPRRGQGRRRGAKLAQSPWVPLLIGLRSFRSIWSQVQFLPFPCGEGKRGTAWTMT